MTSSGRTPVRAAALGSLAAALLGIALLTALLTALPTPVHAESARVRADSTRVSAPSRREFAPTRRDGGGLTVRAAHARVVIQRHPFGLSFQDGAGRTVLREVSASGPGVQIEPPTTDPLPPGVDNPRTTTLYQPLSFLVGTEKLQQQPADEWEGNLLTGVRSGIQYAARDVLTAQRLGAGGRAGVRLVLSTTDPTGRHLVVLVRPQGTGAVRVTARPVPAAGVAMIGDSFASDRGEGFFGFGGRHDRLDQRGQVLSSFVNEENLAARTGPAGLPGPFAMFPNGPAAAYYPQAQFTSIGSDRAAGGGYGFLLGQPELARFKLDADRPDAWNVTASATHLDYVVAPGPPARSTRAITAITGRQPVPPRWALGTMLDRLVKNQGESFADYQGMLRADVRNIDRYHLPLTGYRIEGWGFPGGNHGLALHTWVHPHEQAKMIAALRHRHIHALAYLRPWLTPDSAPARRFAVRDAQGDPDYVVVSGEKRVGLVDFTDPAAVRWWQRQVADVLDLGFDGFMQDYGEQVLFDMRFHDGSSGVTEHDRYLTQYARATRGALTRYHRAHPARHPWFFTRAGYSGSPGHPGSAAYEGGNFPGDETTDWGHLSGLSSLATDMLNRAVGGAYGFGTDIGGYLDYTTPATSKELFLRWAEWAALSPIFRLHGTGLAGTHTPWSYDAATVRTYNALSRLHLAARPLIERLWRRAVHTGAPVTRPLWWQHPGDRRGWAADQEWLLGPHVLVAPVVDEGVRSRTVYLPAGCWQRRAQGTTRRYAGHRTVRVAAPLDSLPYFVTCGTRLLGSGA